MLEDIAAQSPNAIVIESPRVRVWRTRPSGEKVTDLETPPCCALNVRSHSSIQSYIVLEEWVVIREYAGIIWRKVGEKDHG